MSFETYIKLGDATYHTRWPFDEEVSNAIQFAGFDVASFNKVVWPTGAGRHGTIRILMHSGDVEVMWAEIGDVLQTVDVLFADMLFEGMCPLPPKPILATEGVANGVLYAVDLVDERFFWSQCHFGDGFMATMEDRESIFDDSNVETIGAAVDALLDELGVSSKEVVTTGRMGESDPLRDMLIHGHRIGPAIDKILSLAGYVLRAVPNASVDPIRYKTVALEDGDQAAIDFLTAHDVDLVAGGFVSFQSESGLQGVGRNSLGQAAWAKAMIPTGVTPHFPTATKFTASSAGTSATVRRFRYNDEDESGIGIDHVMGRVNSPLSYTNGKPENGGDSGNSMCLWSSYWSIHNGSETESNSLVTVSEDISTSYYARFLAGVGNAVFRDVIPFEPWSGCSRVEYLLHPSGAFTKIVGDLNDPIFGFRTDLSLTAEDITGIGHARAWPRPWGGVLLDVFRPASLWSAKITAVSGSSPDFVYDAVAYEDPTIVVENEAPVWSATSLALTAASVDDECIIGVKDDGETFLILIETADHLGCS